MKTIELKLKKRILLVETDTGNIFAESNGCFYTENINRNNKVNANDPDSWRIADLRHKLIGKLSDLKERDFAELVKEGVYLRTFWNYIKNDNHKSNQMNTAKESFESAVESQGYFIDIHDVPIPDISQGIDNGWIDAWNEAESKTFKPERSYIFEIKQ